MKIAILIGIPILASALWAGAPKKSDGPATIAVITSNEDPAAMRLEGVKLKSR